MSEKNSNPNNPSLEIDVFVIDCIQRNTPRWEIEELLIKRGFDRTAARRILRRHPPQTRKLSTKSRALRIMLLGSIILAFGCVITSVSYNLARDGGFGGFFIVTTGLFISGGFLFLGGLSILLMGK